MSLLIQDASSALIFSDLDGTLLDHHSYSYEAALSTLQTLAKMNVPVILNTSKTAAEVKVIHKELGLATPFIIENGAAIYMPKNAFAAKPKEAIWQDGYWVKTFASKRSHWLGIVAKLKERFAGQFEGFSNMSLERISEVTGLSNTDAAAAAKRLYGEPVLWTGTDANKTLFIEEARKLGAFPLVGGRFIHICGDSNKGKALTWLSKEYARQRVNKGLTTKLSTIALGDGNNDIAMLEAATIAVRIKSPVNPPPPLTRQDGVYTSTQYGPSGWRESIENIIPELKNNNTNTGHGHG
ncbi:HAD-IIB family hydrolase [Glaciecola siphonariae]|uniref:HAD-IIB family hydrolase n=1 Tax=Glaciecola siphonariae TaxID=521012 RepID=A0ABV9LUH4_9ALTE